MSGGVAIVKSSPLVIVDARIAALRVKRDAAASELGRLDAAVTALLDVRDALTRLQEHEAREASVVRSGDGPRPVT